MIKRRLLTSTVLCATLLGCAKNFPPQEYNAADTSYRASLQRAQDYDSRLALARLYFEHNQIDDADQLLRALVKEDPNSAEALAWYGANNCKLAGRLQDWWTMGLRKLYLVHECLGEVTEAAQRAPTDPTVQLVLVNTGAVVNMFGSLDQAQAAVDKLLADDQKQGNRNPPGLRAHIFLAAAEVANAKGNKAAAKDYLERVVALNADATTVAMAKSQLALL